MSPVFNARTYPRAA